MKTDFYVCNAVLRGVRRSIYASCAVLLVSTAFAQETPDLEELEAQLEQQRLALQEAIADREATFFRSQDIEAQLNEAQEANNQIEDELKELCEEQEELTPGTMEECMETDS